MTLYLIIYFGLIFSLFAQGDLLDQIDNIPEQTIPVTATFKATRIVNSQSIEYFY